MGRVKLQQELAAQKGVFFHSVCQNVARRMYPSQSCDQRPMELLHRGVSATGYLERFGGFGKSRDLGQIAWQVLMLMDHLQVDNLPAAKDSAARLLVCQEQGSMDAGHLDIGLLLSLAEDPPSTGALLYQGARHDRAEMSRLGVISKGGTSAGCSPYSKDEGQGSCKAELEEGQKSSGGRSRGVNYDGEAAHVPECFVHPDFKGGSKSKTNKQKASQVPLPCLEECISFPKLLAALPRWILSSRTPFACFFSQVVSHPALCFRGFPLTFASARTFQRWGPQTVSSSLDLPTSQKAGSSCGGRSTQLQSVYELHGVLGSPEKDVEASDAFIAVGTRVDSSEAARSRGIAVVSAPPEKLAGLVALTARVFQLPIISRTLASRITGSWTSVLLHRRCLSCVLDRIYAFGVRDEKNENEVLSSPRAAARGLALCCALAFVSGSEVSVPYASRLFATDASLHKGAIVSREIPKEPSAAIWLGGDKKGAYTKLDNTFACAPKHLGLSGAGEDDPQEEPVMKPSHGLDFALTLLKSVEVRESFLHMQQSWG